MNENTLKFIFLFLVGTSVLNFAIALLARVKTKNSEFNTLIAYWPAVILSFVMAGVLRHTPTEMGIAYFFQGISSNLMVQVFRSSLGLKSHWKFYLPLQAVTMAFSAFLLTQTDVGFTFSLLPLCVAFSMPFLKPIWYALVENKEHSNWVEKSLAVVFITAVLHHFNLAFFRLVPDTEAIGFSITIAEYQCMSIFLPLMINHRREMNERKNLQQALEKISGNQMHIVPINELYQQLEIQIAQKDHFHNELQTSNKHLEEEREMNEMLIRTISHDLANPLTVIGAYTEMLHAGKIPPEDNDKIWGRVKVNTQSALDMIGRIRNAILTRTQASLVAIHDVSVDRTIKRLHEMFDSRLKEKDITLIYNNNISPDLFVQGEENALTEHVFANILSNAIKFSYPGSEILIDVSENENGVEVSFQDYGTGIKIQRLEKRLLLSTQGTQGESGTGFGLMVMGYFLRQFGASVEMSSQTEGVLKGTTVTVSLKKSLSNTDFPIIIPSEMPRFVAKEFL